MRGFFWVNKANRIENKNPSMMRKEELEHYMLSVLTELKEILDIADKRKAVSLSFWLRINRNLDCNKV